MIVDTHPHLLAADLKKYPITPIGGTQSEWSKGRHLTAEDLLQHMDEAGVERAVLVQAATVHGYDNSYCADSAQRYPDRFVAVCTIDVLAPDAPDRLSYWVEERGIRGLRLFTTGSNLPETGWLDDPQTFPVWERSRSLGIPVCVQIRLSGLPRLGVVLERFPDVPVLLDHLASPPIEDGPPFAAAQPLFDLAHHPNLYLKFSPHNLQATGKGGPVVQPFFQQLVERFGPRRLMWGSNFPNSRWEGPPGPYRGLVELAVDSLSFLSEEERRRLLGETALTLYPWLPV